MPKSEKSEKPVKSNKTSPSNQKSAPRPVLKHLDKQTVQLLPLGGVGRMGMNAMLLICGDDAVLLDCGVSFVDNDIPGIDVMLPSLRVLADYKKKLRAIVLTHGHEDHIGALPHVLRLFPVPIYSTRFTAALIQQRLREHGMESSVNLSIIKPGKNLKIGPFDFNFLRVTHSLPDCVSLAIGTPAGNILFTGDFKIEQGLRDGSVFDEAGFRAFGDSGCALMMSDSTNAEVPGWSASESSVATALVDVIGACKGRAIVGLFASNLYRVHTVVDAARAAGRYTVLMGRSLDRYVECANNATDMPFDKDDFIEAKDMHLYDDDELCIICTGSQAESRAALGRAAQGIHPTLSIKNTDTVILSSRVIPGNEKRIYSMINDLARRGAHIISTRTRRDIHASGHAYSDEQRALLSWVRPKYFFPVHGEYTFLQRHCELAAEVGAKNVLAENGQILELTQAGVSVRDLVEVSPWYADGSIVGDAETLEIKARERLAFNGVVAVSARLKIQRGVVVPKVRVMPSGVYQGNGELTAEIEKTLNRCLTDIDVKTAPEKIEALITQQVRKACKRYTTRKPVVLSLVEIEKD
jgi:ribonuclease J